jgi:hypothetical protein
VHHLRPILISLSFKLVRDRSLIGADVANVGKFRAARRMRTVVALDASQ